MLIGHGQAGEDIEQVRAARNPGLDIEGILRTMHDPRNNLDNQVSAQLIQHFGDKVFRTIIPRNVRLAEAPSHGLPVLHYDPGSRGALAYIGLAGELPRGKIDLDLFEEIKGEVADLAAKGIAETEDRGRE